MGDARCVTGVCPLQVWLCVRQGFCHTHVHSATGCSVIARCNPAVPGNSYIVNNLSHRPPKTLPLPPFIALYCTNYRCHFTPLIRHPCDPFICINPHYIFQLLLYPRPHHPDFAPNELERSDQERHSGMESPHHDARPWLIFSCRRLKPSNSASISYVSIPVLSEPVPLLRACFRCSKHPIVLVLMISCAGRDHKGSHLHRCRTSLRRT